MDDIPANVEVLSFQLVVEGYQVVEAQSSEPALTIFQSHLNNIDLIMLDVMMPVMMDLIFLIFVADLAIKSLYCACLIHRAK
jgi:CheY-like chemotaxis protein